MKYENTDPCKGYHLGECPCSVVSLLWKEVLYNTDISTVYFILKCNSIFFLVIRNNTGSLGSLGHQTIYNTEFLTGQLLGLTMNTYNGLYLWKARITALNSAEVVVQSLL